MALSGNDVEELPCGRRLDELVEQVAERRPSTDAEHQASCRYCRALLAELDALWDDVGRLARLPVDVPPGLIAAAMRRIDRDRDRARRPPTAPRGPRPGRPGDHAVLDSARGETRIADGVVEAIAGRAALTVAGVRAAPVDVRIGGATVAVALELTVSFGPPLAAVIAAVRAAVVEAVEGLTGVGVSAVDVAVADVVGD